MAASLMTGLMEAVACAEPALVELFLLYGVDVNEAVTAPSGNVLTPIAVAPTRRMAELLLEKGADPNLHCPLSHAMINRGRVARALLRGGAQVNAFDAQGMTPLSLASRKGAGRMVGMLLKHGADPTLANRDGSTPLSLVRRQLERYATMDVFDLYYYNDPPAIFQDVEKRLLAALDRCA